MRTPLRLLLLLVLALRTASAQETRIRGFADVTFTASHPASDNAAFGLGQYDFYVTSALADKWSFLGESVFEFKGDFVVDVERLVVTHRPTAHFQIAVGKHHTPFGYWNTAYHHGTLIQPTIKRPTMFLFEDDGGILPVHTTGLMVAGRNLTSAHLGFDAMVGNGIGSTPISDNNQAKSVTVAVHSQVTHALQLGVSYYVDRITAGTRMLYGSPVDTTLAPGDTVGSRLTHRMVGGYAVYFGPALELMGEYLWIRHQPASGGASTGTDAFYAYGGYRVGKLVSYVRYDALLFDAADAYYRADDLHLVVVGARYDFAATAQLKLEYHHQSTAREGRMNEVQAQLAVGF